MPSPSTTELPKPRSWDELEDIASDLLRGLWDDPYVQRYGRSGQQQHGVDIIGRPSRLAGELAGAQCKRTSNLTIGDIEDEVRKAQGFRPALTEYVVVTSMSRDAGLQDAVRNHDWPFRVEIMFWEDVSLLLSGDVALLEKHYPGWVRTTSSASQIIQNILQARPEDFRYDDSMGVYFHVNDTDLRIVLDRSESA